MHIRSPAGALSGPVGARDSPHGWTRTTTPLKIRGLLMTNRENNR
jgi:hypothetical protein